MFSRFTARRCVSKVNSSAFQQLRFLNLHEYASKKLLAEFGCTTEMGIMCESMNAVKEALAAIPTEKKVVKSQILAGGRGKGKFKNGFEGGVHVVDGSEAAMEVAKQMLGNTLVTKQTGPNGLKVTKLFITEFLPGIKRECYLALTLDRKTCCPTFIGSAEGGMNIEEVAAKKPDAIKKMRIKIQQGIQEEECRQYAKDLGFVSESLVENVVKQLKGIYNLAKARDATMVEINPLAELEDGTVVCADAKLSFDDNAQFRRQSIWALQDISQKDPKEAVADQYDLNYIALDGNVGCMVNGAGLAMGTMDLISLHGAKPANFLDVGGSAKSEQIVKAFEIITLDPQVKCILVNIFGGIMKCDVIAQGVVDAVKQLGEKLKVPIVCRLEGTNDELGKEILKKSGLEIFAAETFAEAGKKAAELAKA